MTEKTFEEQFPSLNKKGYYLTYRNGKEDFNLSTSVHMKDIYECCLDKQKVRDAINQICSDAMCDEYDNFANSLMRKLNLGDEE